MQIPIYIASVAGIGFIKKGGGTIAAMFFCLIWYFLPESYVHTFWQIIVLIFLIALGIWSSTKVDSIWGKDSSKVVIDEVAGMAISLVYLPHTFYYMMAGLILFRIFDIVKPFGIRQLEKLPKGWGVMADDIAAGLYSFIVLRLIIYFN